MWYFINVNVARQFMHIMQKPYIQLIRITLTAHQFLELQYDSRGFKGLQRLYKTYKHYFSLSETLQKH